MEDLEPRFESTGEKEATYTIHLANSDIGQLAWIYADGRICVNWIAFGQAGDLEAEDRMRAAWAPYVNSPANKANSFTKDRLGVLTPEFVAGLFQRSVEKPEAGRPTTA